MTELCPLHSPYISLLVCGNRVIRKRTHGKKSALEERFAEARRSLRENERRLEEEYWQDEYPASQPEPPDWYRGDC